jgi:hypothetical protein
MFFVVYNVILTENGRTDNGRKTDKKQKRKENQQIQRQGLPVEA